MAPKNKAQQLRKDIEDQRKKNLKKQEGIELPTVISEKNEPKVTVIDQKQMNKEADKLLEEELKRRKFFTDNRNSYDIKRLLVDFNKELGLSPDISKSRNDYVNKLLRLTGNDLKSYIDNYLSNNINSDELLIKLLIKRDEAYEDPEELHELAQELEEIILPPDKGKEEEDKKEIILNILIDKKIDKNYIDIISMKPIEYFNRDLEEIFKDVLKEIFNNDYAEEIILQMEDEKEDEKLEKNVCMDIFKQTSLWLGENTEIYIKPLSIESLVMMVNNFHYIDEKNKDLIEEDKINFKEKKGEINWYLPTDNFFIDFCDSEKSKKYQQKATEFIMGDGYRTVFMEIMFKTVNSNEFKIQDEKIYNKYKTYEENISNQVNKGILNKLNVYKRKIIFDPSYFYTTEMEKVEEGKFVAKKEKLEQLKRKKIILEKTEEDRRIPITEKDELRLKEKMEKTIEKIKENIKKAQKNTDDSIIVTEKYLLYIDKEIKENDEEIKKNDREIEKNKNIIDEKDLIIVKKLWDEKKDLLEKKEKLEKEKIFLPKKIENLKQYKDYLIKNSKTLEQKITQNVINKYINNLNFLKDHGKLNIPNIKYLKPNIEQCILDYLSTGWLKEKATNIWIKPANIENITGKENIKEYVKEYYDSSHSILDKAGNSWYLPTNKFYYSMCGVNSYLKSHTGTALKFFDKKMNEYFFNIMFQMPNGEFILQDKALFDAEEGYYKTWEKSLKKKFKDTMNKNVNSLSSREIEKIKDLFISFIKITLDNLKDEENLKTKKEILELERDIKLAEEKISENIPEKHKKYKEKLMIKEKLEKEKLPKMKEELEKLLKLQTTLDNLPKKPNDYLILITDPNTKKYNECISAEINKIIPEVTYKEELERYNKSLSKKKEKLEKLQDKLQEKLEKSGIKETPKIEEELKELERGIKTMKENPPNNTPEETEEYNKKLSNMEKRFKNLLKSQMINKLKEEKEILKPKKVILKLEKDIKNMEENLPRFHKIEENIKDLNIEIEKLRKERKSDVKHKDVIEEIGKMLGDKPEHLEDTEYLNKYLDEHIKKLEEQIESLKNIISGDKSKFDERIAKLKENPPDDIKEKCKITVSYYISREIVDYIFNMNKDKNLKSLIEDYVSKTVYFNNDILNIAEIFKERLKNIYYSPELLYELTKESVIPEIFIDSSVDSETKDIVEKGITYTIKIMKDYFNYNVYYIINSEEKQLLYLQPNAFQFPKKQKKRLREICDNINDISVDILPQDLYSYKEGEKYYCFDLTNPKLPEILKDGINPYNTSKKIPDNIVKEILSLHELTLQKIVQKEKLLKEQENPKEILKSSKISFLAKELLKIALVIIQESEKDMGIKGNKNIVNISNILNDQSLTEDDKEKQIKNLGTKISEECDYCKKYIGKNNCLSSLKCYKEGPEVIKFCDSVCFEKQEKWNKIRNIEKISKDTFEKGGPLEGVLEKLEIKEGSELNIQEYQESFDPPEQEPRFTEDKDNCIDRSLLPLTEYQKKVVEFMNEKEHRGLIVVHGLGTGKTLTAVTVSQCYLDANPTSKVLVISPKSLLNNFENGMKAYGNVNYDKRYKYKTFEDFLKIKENAKDKQKTMENFCKNTLLIVDEAHLLRTKIGKNKGKKAEAVLSCSNLASKVLLLTATPYVNETYDMANLVAMVKGEDKPLSKAEWNKKWNNVREREQYFKCLFSVYDKDQYSKDYPRRIDIEKEIEMDKEFYNEYMKIEKLQLMDDNPKHKTKEKQQFDFFAALRKKLLEDKKFTEITDNNKVKFVIDETIKKVKEGKKVVIYSNLVESGIKKIAEILNSKNIVYRSIIGNTPQKERVEYVKEYNDKKVSVLLLSSAGGTGLNLLETNAIFILDPPWNETNLEQAIGRVIRYKSHEKLPEDERYVEVYLMYTIKPKNNSTELSDPIPSVDTKLKEIINKKKEENRKVIEELRNLSIENSSNNCYGEEYTV